MFVQTGYTTQHIIAIDPTGSGDATSKIVWKNRKDAPNTPTPIADGKELYVVSDAGKLTCCDAKTGTVHWAERLKGKNFSSLTNPCKWHAVSHQRGRGRPGREGVEKRRYEEVSLSDLKEKTFATFVPGNSELYVRTETQLYKFAK